MHRAGIVLRSQLNSYLIRLWHFAAIFLMSLIGAVAMAVFVLLMSASAACAEGVPMETSGADVDLAIVGYVLEDMGPFHRLSMTVANMGSDSLAYSFDIGIEVKIRTDFSQVFARHEEAVSLPVELPPGGLREFSFDLVDRQTGERLPDGEYQLALWATNLNRTNLNRTSFIDRDWYNNWVDDIFVVDEPAVPSKGASLPARPLAVQANACNPFDQGTSILYELAESVDVELTIFDRLGRKVRTLANARQAAGEYSVEWDGRDEVGWVVADGAYFYRLRLGEYAQTRRLMRLN